MAPANREGRLHAVSMIRNANRTASLLLAVSAEARAAEMSGEMPVCCRGMLFLLQPPPRSRLPLRSRPSSRYRYRAEVHRHGHG